jgi:hypothetical protein
VIPTFNGEIERVAVWEKALSKEMINKYMKKIRETVDVAGNNVNIQESGFFNLNRNTERWSGIKFKTSNNLEKLKILGICKFSGAREMLELSRLMDFDLWEALIMYVPGTHNGIGVNRKGRRTYLHVEGYYSDNLRERLLEGLKQDTDAIIIGHVDFFRLPNDIQAMIMQKVRLGTGLVLAYTPKLNKLKAKMCEKKLAGPDLFRALPKQYMPEIREIPNIDSLIDFYSYGKGRIAILNWPDDNKDMIRHKGLKFHSISYLPDWSESTKEGWAYQFSLAIAARAVSWAVKQNAVAGFTKIEPEFSNNSLADNEMKINIFANSALEAKLNVFIRNFDNEICFKQNNNLIKLKKGENIISLPVPELPKGTFSFDCQLQYGENIIDYGASVFTVKKSCCINKISLNKRIYKQLEMLDGNICLDGNIKDKTLLVKIYDTQKRLIGKKQFPIQSKETHFSLNPLYSYTTGNMIHAVLQDKNGKTLDTIKQPYFIDRSSELRKLFALSIWAYLPSDYIGEKFLSPLKRYPDIDIYLPHYSFQKEEYLRNASEWALLNGFSSVSPALWREYYHARKDVNDIVRTPCLTSPEYIKYSKKEITKYAKIASDYLPLYYSLGDESYLVSFWKGVDGRDVCASPTCNASFREYLRKQYKSLEKLNHKWNKNYTDWETIRPEIFQDAVKNGNISPWGDHRLHMSQVYMNKLEDNASTIKNIANGALVGAEGFYKPDPFKGYDLNIFATKFNFLGPYGYSMDPYTCDVFEALTPADKDYKRFAITGWYPNVNTRTETYSKFEPWTSLLHGQDGLLLFSAIGLYGVGAVQDGISSGFNLSEYWRQILDEAMVIRNRYYDLISNCERNNKNIAIYYSNSSLIVSQKFTPHDAKRPLYFDEGEAWDIFLSSSSLDHTFISSDQVIGGKLKSDKKPGILILPGIFSLSDKEVKEIKQFVKSGGILVADIFPGVMDEHGAIRQENPLSEVFGIKVLDIKLNEGKKTVHLNKHAYFPLEKMMPIKLDTAKSILNKTNSLCFIRNGYGKGAALLANTTMQNYVELSKQGNNIPIKRLLFAWLAQAGVNIPFSIQSVNNVHNFLECIEYRDKQNSYLGILKSPQFSDRKNEEFQIVLDKKKYIYDPQRGVLIAHADRFKDKLNGKMANFYSILPYSVESIEIQKITPEIHPGEFIKLNIKINTCNGLAQMRHFVQLRIKGITEHSIMVEVNNGFKEVQIPTALNSPNKISVEAIDSATGIRKSTCFEILNQ